MRRRKRRLVVLIPLIVVIIAAGSWWLWQRGDGGGLARNDADSDQPVAAQAEQPAGPVVPEAVVVARMPTEAGEDEVLTPVGGDDAEAMAALRPVSDDAETDSTGDEPVAGPTTEDEQEAPPRLSRNARIDASLERYQAGQVIAARQELNGMLVISRNSEEQAELRRHLAKIADDTIFSKRVQTDDPLIATCTIQPGEYLINVGKRFNVPHEVIMFINGIEDATRVRAGQKLKVPRGPFHAKIYKSQYRLEVYLQDQFVRSFPVGLGTDHGTPEGVWRVKERLPNPTYYPPASAPIKRIIPPDDPTNPLGEHWIGLEGIEGDALGREGYGIHGTIEPESVGRPVSLGCIRMHNEDVAFLYRLMMPGQSKVTILP